MKIGTGWLGWTEAQVMDTTMTVIVDAYEARLDMLRFLSGRPAPKQAMPAGSALTPDLFMAMFGKIG